MQLKSGRSAERGEEGTRMESEMVVAGAIIDSWIEPTQAETDRTRLVLQVAPRAAEGFGYRRSRAIAGARPIVAGRFE